MTLNKFKVTATAMATTTATATTSVSISAAAAEAEAATTLPNDIELIYFRIQRLGAYVINKFQRNYATLK